MVCGGGRERERERERGRENAPRDVCSVIFPYMGAATEDEADEDEEDEDDEDRYG